MHFTLLTPQYLLLLLVMPAIIWLFWHSTIHLSPFRRGLVLGFRVLIVALLVFSLCGLSVENPTEQVNVMFALDVSDSVGEEGREAALDFLQRALRQMKKGDQGGLVVFGADASVEASLQPAPEVNKIASTVSGQATDIGHALELAMAQFPPARQKASRAVDRWQRDEGKCARNGTAGAIPWSGSVECAHWNRQSTSRCAS